jgi:hypothetical protein
MVDDGPEGDILANLLDEDVQNGLDCVIQAINNDDI